MTILIEPSQSINIAVAQHKLQYSLSSIDDYPNVKNVVANVLSELNASNLLEILSNVKVLLYPYQFVVQENKGITMIYSFAVLEGKKGDLLEDKIVLDPVSLKIISNAYQIPEDAPFIVLGKVNENDDKYLISSISHEISHILVDYVETNDNFLVQLSNMIPDNLTSIPTDEAIPIMFEVKVLNKLFDGQEIMKYLIDRYIIDYEENVEMSESYIKDLRALVSVA